MSPMEQQKYVICDLDGTLCNHNHRVYLAWSSAWEEYNSACEFDSANKPVADFLMRQLQTNSVSVVFLTGRTENYREITEKWLRQLGFHGNYHLIMRPLGEYQAAREFKFEALTKWRIENVITPDQIKYAIDDNEECVQMFKELGIKKVIHYK